MINCALKKNTFLDILDIFRCEEQENLPYMTIGLHFYPQTALVVKRLRHLSFYNIQHLG